MMEEYLQFALQIYIFIWGYPEERIIFLNMCC